MFDYPTRDDFRAHLMRAARLLPGLAVAWGVVAIGASRLATMRSGDFGAYDFVGAALCGLTIGGAMAWFETRPVRRGYLNRYPWLDIALRTLVYTIVVGAAVIAGRTILFHFFPEEANGAVWRPLGEMWDDFRVRRFIILLFLASFALNFILHLRLHLGPRNLEAIFTGKYRLPVLEERLFVFIDLIDSTAIAQRIGPLEFTHFKHDFFCDLARPVQRTGGHIVQYVGDEVMITWRRRDLHAAYDPMRFLRLARLRVGRRRAYYLERYGAVPTFRTGIHAGHVVVAEVGDSRRDIVYSGDVVNTAARLLQACRPERCSVLVSREALAWLPGGGRLTDPDEAAARSCHLELRGRREGIDALAIGGEVPSAALT